MLDNIEELQTSFADYVSTKTDVVLPNIGNHAKARLDIYRNNTIKSLTEALSANFPISTKLLGAEYFNQAAGSFIPTHLPKKRALHEYGADFPQFLAKIPELKNYSYIEDVAKFEWLWSIAYHADDFEPLKIDELNNVGEEILMARFVFNPSCSIFKSNFRVHEIWQAHYDNFENKNDTINAFGQTHLLINRESLVVKIYEIDVVEYEFLKLLQEHCFKRACERIVQKYPLFEIQEVLSKYFLIGIFSEINFGEQNGY